MSEYIVWWIIAAVLVGAELVTGTFYLLALGVAGGVGGLVAWLGFSLQWQLAVAAAVAIGGTLLAHHWRVGRSQPTRMANLDLGQEVRVDSWREGGCARVAYRGSTWDAEVESTATRQQERMFIAAVRGNTLVLSDRRPGT